MLWSTSMIFYCSHPIMIAINNSFWVQDHGITLSEKKSSIAKESIDFLSMLITNGHYQPGPHIATELLKFPDTNLTKKQIQQFLGIVNYVRDFIPKVAIHTSQLSRMLKK